jgi:ribosomal protein S1
MGLVMSRKIKEKVDSAQLKKKPVKVTEKALEPDPWERKKNAT